ncbi:hypothetical protein [Haloarcula marismortui]|uniref:Glycosyltransferase RgtA/B/C/D-like domain-containing protein n=1 Tax=Haloarcula marismortui ATCC 33800 TaxID=662476 RepID=M0JZM4_9EURY|nr:hypothetical protein [Haloarcula sinaiiensis]EMA13963.1 hypothetical protein C436_08487 [Haloarcula sinaiiensis ATCC 33800]QUJ73129.1 hypothetical protein KDQ40_05095 [Haloarcula sinaiiensis ATCC 33800]
MLFTSLGFLSLIGPILGATVGGILALLFLHVWPFFSDEGSSEAATWSPPDYRVAAIITSLYVTSLLWVYRGALYERPTVHYVLFGGFAAYIGYEIGTGATHRRVLPQILILVFFTYWSTQLSFPKGMFNADTRGAYLPIITDALASSQVEGPIQYLGHLVYATETILVTGLSAQTGYFLLAVLLLTGTVLIIGILDRIFPAISPPTALYASLFFSCSAWTLSRGFRPSKLAFFYGTTLLLGFVVVVQYSDWSIARRRWLIIGLFVGPTLILGHRFSAGAALVFVVAISAFFCLASFWPWSRYKRVNIFSIFAFSGAYTLANVGTPVHQRPLLTRLTGLLTSVFVQTTETGGSGGGPGRYSALAIDLLLLSTSSQAILFCFGVLGAAIAIRRVEWEFDLGIFWMGALSMLLLISLVFNAADVQPQRFYALLGLFGLNVFAGVALVWLIRTDIRWLSPHTAGAVLFAFAVLSLASPVASLTLSPVGDEIPHIRLYETEQLDSSQRWVTEYQGDKSTLLDMNPPHSEVPVQRTGTFSARVNVSGIPAGHRYGYSDTATETGVRIGGGLGIGDREYVFLEFNQPLDHGTIYSNGDTSFHVAG